MLNTMNPLRTCESHTLVVLTCCKRLTILNGYKIYILLVKALNLERVKTLEALRSICWVQSPWLIMHTKSSHKLINPPILPRSLLE